VRTILVGEPSRGCDKFEIRIVAASGKQHAGGGSGGDVFDVRVVAFAGGTAATLKGLQDLFGLDREGAQRLVDSVPLVVRRAAPANEAQSFVAALRGIGAQVALERAANQNGVGPTRNADPAAGPRPAPPGARPAPPAPARFAPPPPPKLAPGKAPPPPPREADPLPRPIMRAPSADLEFDIGSSSSGDGIDGLSRSSAQSAVVQKSSRGRNEIDFSGEPSTGALELDIGDRDPAADRTGAARTNVAERPTAGRAANAERNTSKGVATPTPSSAEQQGSSESRAESAGRMSVTDISRVGPGPMSRAAVVHKPGIDPKDQSSRRRQLALLRVLGAVGVAALGFVFDSSIAYGNANLISVVAHAVAIYQLGVGLRGLTP
jgi:ribosomal protein L7/L12